MNTFETVAKKRQLLVEPKNCLISAIMLDCETLKKEIKTYVEEDARLKINILIEDYFKKIETFTKSFLYVNRKSIDHKAIDDLTEDISSTLEADCSEEIFSILKEKFKSDIAKNIEKIDKIQIKYIELASFEVIMTEKKSKDLYWQFREELDKVDNVFYKVSLETDEDEE